MQKYEFRVVPAPERGLKAKGIKGAADRFAHALESVMNRMGAEGWDYVRADTLPATERSGLTSSHTVYRNMLVFRRPLEDERTDEAPDVAAPEPDAAAIAPEPEPAAETDLPAEPELAESAGPPAGNGEDTQAGTQQ